ncbi:MAG: tetratricopeptide repeat protein [Anaerolineae bacterium]
MTNGDARAIFQGMLRQELILRTKLAPPRTPRHTLLRPRVQALLAQALDYRLTVVQAGTGYGKSTALAGLAQQGIPLFWYSVGEGEADPQPFLAHLIAAFRVGLPALSDTPLALLQEMGAARVAVDALLNASSEQLNSPALLVLDDYHLAASNDVSALVDHFLTYMSPHLHLVIATRYPPRFENMAGWRVRDEVLEIHRQALAFTQDEIGQLFRETYGLALAPRDIQMLADKTEGWPIALQLVWQELRANPRGDIATWLATRSGSHDTLFEYLAHDVLAQQSRAIQDFLLQTCILRDLTPVACDAVTDAGIGSHNGGEHLAALATRDLFVTNLGGDHYRYHHLFHDFLRAQAQARDADAVRRRHLAAGEFYRRAGNGDEALYHLLQAEAFEEAATLIQEIGENVVREGRLDTLAGWVDTLPPAVVAAHPQVMFLLGHLARLRSRFDDALGWYAQAERVWRVTHDVTGIARALRGQALVYLDTVRPARAEALLQEALKLDEGLNDREAHVRLLELLAENKLNMGKVQEAEQLRIQARNLREESPSEDVLSVRVKLRTGRLDEARTILEGWAQQERGQLHAPRFHRETLLILSLIYSMQGQADKALAAAQDGIGVGRQLQSSFISAVGHMRLGHAYQVKGELGEAVRCYQEAVRLGDELAVRRTRAEARWGMTRAHGWAGDLEAARRDAEEGLEIAQAAGDAWMVALILLSWGVSDVVMRQESQGLPLLADALEAFRECGDTFGMAAARLWLALGHWRIDQHERALPHLEEALSLALAHHYDYLMIRPTLLGWRDPRVIVPVMLQARQHGIHTAYIGRLLAASGLDKVTFHPGYQLRVQTFGAWRVWRGEQEVTEHEWHRRKAKQLFQLLVTHRGRLLPRDEILDLLWRDDAPDTATRDFKVALNALNKALEPARPGDGVPAFITREDSAYGLRETADVWIDADDFTHLIARAEASTPEESLALYRQALALYQDDYLQADARYEEWASAERERLLGLYLRTADRLAQQLLERGNYDECLGWCEKLLARDRCWEHAYRLLMRAYAQRGDRAQACQVFERCTRVLRLDLDVAPSPATVEVFKQVAKE